MKTILVTGAAGQTGQELQALAPAWPHFRFLFAGRFELDITQPQYVSDYFRRHPIDYCINCAAYTAVDQAESEPEQARLLNVEGVKYLAQSCLTRNIPLIHLSTDYVYDLETSRPLVESDRTNPQSVYARTKLEGEQVARQIHPLTTIIRTSWLYSPFGKNFVKTMLRLGREKQELRVVEDQVGSPTYAKDLAVALLEIIRKVETGEAGFAHLRDTYHFSNEGQTSWYGFARAIFSMKGMDVRVQPIPTEEFPTPAHRPAFSVLDKSKIRQTFGLKIPDWEESLRDCLSRIF